VAALTDFAFRDEGAVGSSLFVTAVAFGIVSTTLLFGALRPFRLSRDATRALVD
jgi:hypothetical protein